MRKADELELQLRKLAGRPFPKVSISQDAQTLAHGDDNREFLSRCGVDLQLSELQGFGSFAYHLTPKAYSVLIARTLLKYLTLISGSKSARDQALRSQELADFLSFFSASPTSNFLIEAMSVFNISERSVLKCCAETIIEREMAASKREISFLYEVEDFVAWLESQGI